jgi:hypothetical protein
LFAVRKINGKEYVDYEHCKAFAMVDHQFSHVYVKQGYLDQVKSVLNNVEGVSKILDNETKKVYNIDNDRSGELIAIAEENCWFNYYWWYDNNDAPSFAKNVDIHRKPGYDPLELFFDPSTKGISMNTDLIKGSHGANTRPVPVVISRNNLMNTQESIDATQIAPTIASLLTT